MYNSVSCQMRSCDIIYYLLWTHLRMRNISNYVLIMWNILYCTLLINSVALVSLQPFTEKLANVWVGYFNYTVLFFIFSTMEMQWVGWGKSKHIVKLMNFWADVWRHRIQKKPLHTKLIWPSYKISSLDIIEPNESLCGERLIAFILQYITTLPPAMIRLYIDH